MSYQRALELARERAFQFGRTVEVWFDCETKTYFIVDGHVDVEMRARLIKTVS